MLARLVHQVFRFYRLKRDAMHTIILWVWSKNEQKINIENVIPVANFI